MSQRLKEAVARQEELEDLLEERGVAQVQAACGCAVAASAA